MTIASNEIFELYNKLTQKNVVLSYVGMFNFNISNNFLIMFKKHVNQFDIKLISKKKLYNIMVETLDNVCKHNIETDSNLSAPGLFFLENHLNSFTITTGNLIDNSKVTTLNTKLETINNSSLEELKNLYKDNIVNSSIQINGTAGLGFLDIAIKSGNKFIYNFKKIDENFHFFTFSVSINSEQA